jgi:hypothetical protein
MLVVLAVGFGSLSVLGVWMKRRYDARHQNLYHGKTLTSGPFPTLAGDAASTSVVNDQMWGPHQATAHTRGFDFAPVDEPPQVTGGSRTASSSSNMLVVTPHALASASRNGKGSDPKLWNDEGRLAEEDTGEEKH